MTYKRLKNYILSKNGAEKHFQKTWKWLRYLVNDKMFALICVTDDKRPVLTVRASTSQINSLPLEYPDVVIADMFIEPAHWISIYLDRWEEIGDETIFRIVDKSYNIALQALPMLAQTLYNDEHEKISYDIPVEEMNKNMQDFLEQVNIRVTQNLAEEEKNRSPHRDIVDKLPKLPKLRQAMRENEPSDD